MDFGVKEGFAHAGLVLPRTPRPDTPAAGLEAAKATADLILAKEGQEDGFDVVLECSGNETCMQAAVHVSSSSCPHLASDEFHLRQRLLGQEEKWYTSEWGHRMPCCMFHGMIPDCPG